ncbi:MAG TPA: PIG-L family deacetylase [Thermoanaerobaculia bacterium]|nr:PIG-L family deacetylase [Thermoanaerobaculia bacterium]
MKRSFLALLLLCLCLPAARPQTTAPAPGNPLEPATSGGILALDRLLHRLAVHKRLLVVGAHPDDEDNRLLTLVSRGMGAEVAYLSLSRGEGGQNLLGPHLGVPLGLIRTQELLAARRIDGGRQYFTRAYDFGYTRSLDETLSLWPKAVLLEDATRIVRRFRPQVVVTVFSGTPRDGHGHHQASAVVGREVVGADPSAFRALERGGLPPWKVAALYCCDYSGPEIATIVLPTGAIDPLTGRSYQQIAAASRSNHRSQDMGALQPPGPGETRVAWVEGGAGKDAKDIFAGVDTRLTAMVAGIGDAARRARAEERLRRVEAVVGEARSRLGPATLDQTASSLAVALGELEAARTLVRPEESAAEAAAAAFLDEKTAIAQTALAAATEVTVDAITDRETAAPGDPFEVKISVWSAGAEPARVESVELVSADGWEVLPPPPGEGGGGGGFAVKEVPAGTLAEWTRKVSPAGAVPTIPYFLRRPMTGALYDWSDTPAPERGEPFQPPPLTARVRVRVEGSTLTLSRDVVYRFRDQAQGEVRRPVRAVPALEVSVDPDRIVWPIAERGERRIEVTLASNSGKPLSGRLEIAPPAGWPAIPAVPFSLTGRGDRQFADVPLRAPSPFPPGRGTFRLTAVLSDGQRFASSVKVLDYAHIPPTPMPAEATVEVVAADIRLPSVKRVGYVRGASDRVPEALAAVGVPLEFLGEKDLDSGDLSRFDAIVIGSRAYETDTALVRSNGRILDYARNGGLVIVQYQQYAFVEGGFAPYKIEIARPHDRVTDENAPVRILDPAHPVFTRPNRIGLGDWAGWVQERGLYFAHTWDPAYTPLLEMNDPGQPPQRGALLVAKVGKGHYVYTGLAFFRQLPAGVPGAYRLFANLLGLQSTRHVSLRSLFKKRSGSS